MKLFAFLIVIGYGSLMAATFLVNLPNWCANPQGNGNYIVQPLCNAKE